MNCIICNKEINESKYSNAILCSSECFYIDFWNSIVLEKNDKRSIRIKGIQYWLGNENDKNSFRGFDGRKFKIKLFNNKIIETTNLWMNGEIPENFKSKLPDNAEFLEGDLIKF